MEEWRKIKDYPQYEVSNMGRVKSFKNGQIRILKPKKGTNNYLGVSLCKNGCIKEFRIHRLVAEAFLPNPDNKPCVDHINTDRTDNRAENLRWATHKENNSNPITVQKTSNTLKGRYIGGDNPWSTKVTQSVIGIHVKTWDSYADIKRTLKFDRALIWKACTGKVKKAYGFEWSYAS